MPLYHFSDNPRIETFTPRPVFVPARRAAGRDWLNGPLVWAIDDWHQPMYLFPRDCPRILVWPTTATTSEDYDRHWGACSSRMVAVVERCWMPAIHAGALCRYELPTAQFECLEDAGMWVSSEAVMPLRKWVIADLPTALELSNVELRPTDNFVQCKDLWSTSLHVSGIRLRNAVGWDK